jgi:hypothetical protein
MALRKAKSAGKIACATIGFLDFDQDQGDVVGGGAFAPFGYAIEDAFFHFVEGEAGSFADDFLHAFDAEHFAAGIEDVGDAVGVEDDAVAGIEIHIESGFGVHGIGQRAENHAAGFEEARLGAIVRDHGGRMSGAGENHAAAGTVNARGSDGEEENRTADIVHNEAVELGEHGIQRGAGAQLRHHFGVNAIGDEGGTDAVAGNVADQQIQIVIVERTDQAEIAADSAHGMIKSFDADAAPHQRFRREALLHARGKREVFLNFLMTLFEFFVYFAEFLFGALQIGNVGEGDDGKLAAIGIFDHTGTDNHRHARAIFSGQHEFEAIFAGLQALFSFLDDEIGFRLVVKPMNVWTKDFCARQAGHLLEVGIHENNILAIVGYEHAFIQAFEHALDLLQPIRLFDFH